MGLGRGLGVGVGVRVRARARRTVENSVLTAPGEMHVTRTGVPTRSCLAAVVKAVTWLGLRVRDRDRDRVRVRVRVVF